MEIKPSALLKILAIVTSLQTLVFVLPAQATNRNDVLFDLKDAFNQPISDKFSFSGLIITLVLVLLLLLFFRAYSNEKNGRRKSFGLNQNKRLAEKRINNQSASVPQQRNWFRLATRAEFKWIYAEQALRVRANRYKVDRLIDVSGGGICFSTAEYLKSGDRIKILLNTGKGEPIFLDGSVIRVAEGDGKRKVSVEFTGIRDGQRDKIIAWITDRQRLTLHGEKPEKTRLGQD